MFIGTGYWVLGTGSWVVNSQCLNNVDLFLIDFTSFIINIFYC